MEKFSLICDLIIAIAGVIPTIVSLVYLVKNIIQNKNWSLVMKMAMEAMTAVEEYSASHPEMTSEDKLNMALGAIKKSCAAAGIAVDAALLKRIIDYISEMCSWAKTVNADVVVEKVVINQVEAPAAAKAKKSK